MRNGGVLNHPPFSPENERSETTIKVDGCTRPPFSGVE